MKFVKSKYRKKVLILVLLSFGMILTNLSLSLFNSPFLNNNYEEDNIIDYDDQNILPKTSDSLPSFNGVGNKVNISLHQSYLNTSFNTIVNTSIVNGNNFTLPSPQDMNFNSTYTRFDIEDIYAPNKSLVIEDSTPGFTTIDTNHYTSFRVPTSCYITNLSVNLYSPDTADIFTFDIFGALDDSGTPKFDLTNDLTGLGPNLGSHTNDSSSGVWFTLTGFDTFLNVSDTYDNYFFIKMSTSVGWGRWSTEYEGNGDDTYSYDSSSHISGADLTLKVGLRPIGNNIANASDINLKINNANVTDITDGQGYWESNAVNGSVSGILKYNVSADWWDVTCNISQVQINYTKTDLTADSSFEVLGNGQKVYWNVTKPGGLNYFNSRFNNYRINFTISATWHESSIKVFNGSDEWSINKRLLGNGYREVEVPNAINGTFWFLNATSSNLIDSIDTYVEGVAIYDIANYTDIVRFNTTFSEIVKNGNLNLSVYSPTPNYLNHTNILDLFELTSNTEFNISDWNISDIEIQYGVFVTRIAWNNGTAAGFLIGNLTILGETNLLIDHPSQNTTFNSSTIFNVTITYNDIGQIPDISDGDIYYKINDVATYNSVNESVTYIGNSQYNITFDCNNTEFNYGLNNISIRANNTYYHNQTDTLYFYILGETSLIRSFPKTYNFDSGETFNVTLYFNDTVKNIGIDDADVVNIYVNDSDYTPLDFYDYGNGYYNLTVNCSDDVFDTQGYGDFNLSINVEKTDYYNKSKSTWFIISITGETSLIAIKVPDPSVGYYNSDEIFNITAYFEDINRSEGINGGQAKIYVKEVSASSYIEYTPVIIDPFDVGYYNITVDCSDPIFNPYGKYDIKINITKSHYYTAEDILLGEIIIGNTTLTILDPTGPISYVENEIFDIKIEYEDHTLSSGILGADITYTINGTDYRSDALDNSDGTYNITVDVGDTDFVNNYGNVDIIIRANKSNYINLTRTFTFERQILTQITPFNNPPLEEVMKGINVTYSFNYSDTSGNPIVEYDNFQNTSPLNGFQYYLRNDAGDGNYTLFVNTSNVGVIVDPYALNFSISAFGNQSQDISLTILVTIKQTSIEIESWNDNADFARSTWTNVSVNFYFNDTTNIAAIDGLLDSDIIIKDLYAGTIWQPGFELFTRPGPGNYKLNISTVGKNSGLYTLQLNVSKYQDFNWSLAYIQFYLRGNYTQINMISVSDPEETLTPSGIGNNYTTFLGSDLTIEFNITDIEWNSNVVTQVPDGYFITFKNLKTGMTGTLQQSLSFVPLAPYSHTGDIISSALTDTGFYIINIIVVVLNYENTTFSFNLTLVNSQINIVLISNQGGQLEPSGVGNYYNSTVALDLILDFNITDTESLNKAIARDATVYLVRYINLGTGQNGTIINSLVFNSTTSKYIGALITSGLGVGNYLINVSVVILNYKIIPLTFNLTIVYANSNLESITNLGGQLSPIGVGEFYEPTVTTDIDIEFNVTDANFGNVILIGAGISYTIYYINIDTLENGILLHSITELALTHFGSLDISSLSIGNYSIDIIINKTNNMVSNFSFNIRIVLAESDVISITNPGGQLPIIDNFYDTFIGGNIGIEFNISDVHFETIIQIGAGISYYVYYQNIDTLEKGTLQHALSEFITLHSGSLNISLLPIGNYSFSIIVAKSTNNITSLNFLLRIIEKYETRITITKPESVNAGLPFKIIIKAEFFNGIWLPAIGSHINITLYYNSGAGTSQDYSTNSTGEIEITIPTYSNTIMLNLTIQLRSAYNHQGYTEISDIDIIPIPPSFGFEDILLYLIIAAIAVLTLGGSAAIYRGVVVPKKREKQRILTEVKTIFDDAINLEHILVLYKGTGTCIFFKSYGSEQIDPELIGGFLSAVSSFGKEMATQEALNEISYGDKMLLLADGALIRVALVLGKNASLILRRHLKEFIGTFEKTYNDVLPKWRGQLKPFRNAGVIVDELLNTSIILPHQISYEISSVKDLKNPHSKEVLKIAQSCCEEAEREFFFVATLLKEVADRTNKDTAEIFMGIKELRDKRILIPIEISAIGEQPVSQQEINLINQKVTSLPNLTSEEKQKLVNDLAQLGPIEREAYLSSLTKQQEIVTAPIKTTIGDLSVENQKAAKKGIKELLKRAKIAQSKKSYIKAVEIYQGAAMLASNWELTTEFLKIQETIRKTRIEDLKIKKANLEKEAKSAVKAKKYLEAATKYKYASKMASEIFKLGVTEMTKEVKRLTNKANEYEKMK